MKQHSWIKPILERIDMEWQTVTKWLSNKKQGCKTWWNETNDAISFHCNKIPRYCHKTPNWLKVCVAAFISLLVLANAQYLIPDLLGTTFQDLKQSNGFWTLLTLLVSSPVAFIIWHFRDQNVTQQIENARKDTNLKEFQKLAEWVSGIHLIEDKVVEKTSFEEQQENNEANSHKKEITREYTEPAENLAISTYSKKEGAIGLQISAVYNLLPFYRGDHGESFKKPALNLLTSAWLAMQQKALLRYDKSSTPEEQEQALQKIQENGNSPLGMAITRVLLSLNPLGKPCLLEHPEILADLCLAGMNFTINGIDKSISDIFKQKMGFRGNLIGIDLSGVDLSNANLIGANLIGANLIGANLIGANLIGANLIEADLSEANLIRADLRGADLSKAYLSGADLRGADLSKAYLSGADLRVADLSRANLISANLSETLLIRANLNGANLNGADLNGAYLSEANLNRADLSEANLNSAHLIGADLSVAKLIRSNLMGADLSRANLISANLSETYLIGANLNGANLNGANLNGAYLSRS